LVDAPASGAGDRKVVGVRVPSWAPNTPTKTYMGTKQPFFNRRLNSHGSMQDLGLHFIPQTFKLFRPIF
jgi:hypothetical protein